MQVDESGLYLYIGQRVRLLRRKAGMTQAELADATDELRTSITNIEAGRQRAPLHVLYRICAAVHAEISDFLPQVAVIVDRPGTSVRIGALDRDMPPRAAAFLQALLEPDEQAPEEGE